MEVTMQVGWWLLPAVLTLISVVFVFCWKGFLADAGSDIGARAVSALLDLLVIGVVVIVDLTAWLAWAVLS